MGNLIELPSKKVLSYISVHGHPSKWGWFVRHHYADGETKDFDFFFEDAEEMIRHIRKLTTDNVQ
jgi:hypothetical protein